MSTDYAKCLQVTLTGTDIVVVNNCNTPIEIKRIEVKYYITGLSMEPDSATTREARRLRRLVTENIAVDVSLEPGHKWSYYFGTTSSIVGIRLEVSAKGRRLIVEPQVVAETSE